MKLCRILVIPAIFGVIYGRQRSGYPRLRARFHMGILAKLTVLGLMLLSFSGCIPLHTPEVLVKRAQLHMGTIVTVTAVAPNGDIAQKATAAAFQEIHRLEELLSTWIPTSDLSRLNASAGLQPVAVSTDTIALLKISLDIARMTNGGFSIAVGPAVDIWSVADRKYLPSDAELERIRPLTDLAQVQIDNTDRTVYLRRKGMRLDVGGIGKGYAADRAVTVMRQIGATAGVVALSGDIKTFGRLPGGKKFPFGIRHPRQERDILAFIDLEDEAISTAGDYELFFEREGVRYHHILDPSTLRPARQCQSVTVVANEGVIADGLDTGVFVLGPERGMKLIEALDGVEAVIVDQDGNVMVSLGLRDRLRMANDGKGTLWSK